MRYSQIAIAKGRLMIEAERSPVLVRGVGDVGSAVAAVLFRAGYAVALHDEPAPAAPRRGMAFADAVFDGVARLDGLDSSATSDRSELGRRPSVPREGNYATRLPPDRGSQVRS
jgi:hypothetical protein